MREAVAGVHRVTQNTVLIEQFLCGREVCVAVAGPITAPGGRLVRGPRPTVFAAIERVLMPNEQIFTSMDKRPITQDRTKVLDRNRDAKLLGDMRRLAHQTYLNFDLGSLIRLDLRADEKGELFILEANPKPDLKAPTDSVTSLICAGLGEVGMDYDHLILSLLADRLDFLFTHRRYQVKHLLELVETRTLFDLMNLAIPGHSNTAPPQTVVQPAAAGPLAQIIAIATDLNVMALNAALNASKGGEEQSPSVLPARRPIRSA
jgi:D-alanine-D-alanine ligase